MPLPAARARTPDDCPRILNELLDYIASGIDNNNIRSDAKVGSAKSNSFVSGTLTVGTTELSVPHGLKVTPRSVSITMKSAGAVYESRPANKTHCYLTADAGARTCVVKVEA